MWDSNVKTVDTVRRKRVIKHEVLPVNTSYDTPENFKVEPYKKKKR